MQRSLNLASMSAAACLSFGALIPAQEFEISRSTIDGGGATFSTGGGWELGGTIGQPDAGVLTGGRFTVSGGFWFSTPPGDCNEDGGVSLFDYADFVPCETGPAGGPPAPECRCFDVNRSSTVDLADFALIQRNYTGA